MLSARAGLEWEETTLRLAGPGEAKVEGVFRFRNGATPVEIRKVETSCGCTTVALGKKVYLPGEKGEIRAVFVPGNRQGLQRKTILVQTSDEARQVLKLEVALPESVLLSRGEVEWKVGAPLTAQEVEITLDPAKGARIGEVKSLSSQFQASLTEVEKGRRYLLKVVPLDTGEARQGVVRLAVEGAGGRALYVKVRIVP